MGAPTLRYAILALIPWLFLFEASVMGHYESTQLGTGFWGSASLWDSLRHLPSWASPMALSHLRSLRRQGGCCANCSQGHCARPSPVSLARQSLSFDRQLLHAPSWDITAVGESHFNNSMPFRGRRGLQNLSSPFRVELCKPTVSRLSHRPQLTPADPACVRGPQYCSLH